MRRLFFIFGAILVLISCVGPNKSTIADESSYSGFFQTMEQRQNMFHSAAYLIDLRINDNGQKYSITTEAYFSGDSVGFYGRGYLGKGAFKGSIINDIVTIYFKSKNEYYSEPISEFNSGANCARPGEVLIYVLSLMAGKTDAGSIKEEAVYYNKPKRLKYSYGRFERTVLFKKKRFPKKEIWRDVFCQDSIVINYSQFKSDFPFFKTRDILYYNGLHNFRAKGFIREQRYNNHIKEKKFIVGFPAGALRLESI